MCTKEEYNLKIESISDAIDSNNIYYNCTECSSIIEILSINEENNIIEFQCFNKDKKHKKTMLIKEYLNKMKKYKHKKINKDICEIHNKDNKYVSYCFDCNRHLCKECLKTRNHVSHFKNSIFEFQPVKEELDIIKQIIEDYKNKINNLKKEKMNKNKELEECKLKEKNRLEERIRINKSNKERELKINKDKYLSDIQEIKKVYGEKVKLIRYTFENNNKNIDNKYKLLYEKDFINHKYKIDELNKQYNKENINTEYDKKIENMNNIRILNEMAYNTYSIYNNNYYNSKNINNIIESYYKNENIRNNNIKKKLKNNRNINFNAIKEKYINQKKEKEENDLKIKKIIEEYENKLKEENEKLKKE